MNIGFRNKILTTRQIVMVGLGNITPKYDHTPHNAGFDFINYFIAVNNLPSLRAESKFQSYINRYKIREYDLVVVKPTTFMNLSGDAVIRILNYLDLKDENLLIIHDDLDIKLGKYKFSFEKGPKCHNGIIDIENKIDTNKFWRIRIGVENREGDRKHIPGDKYVTMQMTKDDQTILHETIQDIVEDISQLIF